MFDDKTEIIAHFIGIFELSNEAARLKIQYQEFTAQLAQAPDLNAFLTININVSSSYNLTDFNPNLYWRDISPSIGAQTSPLILSGQSGVVSAPLPRMFPSETAPAPLSSNRTSQTGDQPNFQLPPPAQLATVTAQINVLEDLDVLITYPSAFEFLSASEFNAGLSALQTQADALLPLTTPAPAQGEIHAHETGLALKTQLQSLETDALTQAIGGTSISAAFGADIDPITVNGSAAEALPQLADISHRFAPAESEDETSAPEMAEGALSNPAQSAQGTPLTETDLDAATHEVSAGSNVLINQSSISTNWLDAPVVSVGGQSVEADVISQVNVWSDTDLINGENSTTDSSSDPSQSYNGAEFIQTANPVLSAPADGDAPGNGPDFLAVVTLDGDLLNYNYVQQFNFAQDGDVLSIGFSAQDTLIQTGGNTLINSSDILGLGFHYDMIIIDGDFIDLSFLSQTNVLFDNDWINTQPGFAGDISASDNLLLNAASISNIGLNTHTEITDPFAQTAEQFANGIHDVSAVQGDVAFAELDLLRVLHVTGNVLNLQIIEQVNVLGDGDQVAVTASTLQATDGANVSVTTGENELLNLASITDAGLDSTIYTSEGAYTDAFLYQADFVSEQDPLMLATPDGLASEAFLFLADGLLESDHDEDAGIFAPQSGETAVDVMQTLLA
ncbi:hypothetical protein SAMN04488118_11316 [Epibacterium ulvae]|uniref:Uncharacterized protein n=1 Tax=Epibacterium ulvae TaxID=1156985 RepID=A0A1G5RCM9_9RHOB|nr:hypothetical protein [Epibacterium ulvae]SCZ71864.1 hypothetical protein SAMN04488118_11316 [Epibacterium ulvae]